MSGTVSIPSFAPLPANGLVALRLENAGQANLPGGVTTFGQVFAQGDLPSGFGLTATIQGAAAPVQLDIKSRYDDGSVKLAVVSVVRPDLLAGAAVDLILARGAATPSVPIDLASATANHSFSVDIVSIGGTVSIDVLAALRNALADGSASVWQSGPLASQARVEVALQGSQRLVFDVTAFRGGGIEVEAQFNNDRAMEAVGGRVAYTAIVRMDGREVAREAVDQAQYQNWHRTFSSNGLDGGQGLGDPSAGWLNIQHDTRLLEATGAIPPYNFDLGVSDAKLAAWFTATQQAGWGGILAPNGVTQYMPMTGGREDIGITTAANAAWILTQDARAAVYALGQAEAASAVPWHFWDAANGTWLNTDAYPRLWLDPRGGTGRPGDPTSGGLTQQTPTDTGWTPETAHHPSLSFIPFLLTGERWILDNLNAEASWSILATYPASRQNAQDLMVAGGQVRAGAWTLREIQAAAFANPDGSREKAYFQGASDANWAWLVRQIPTWTEQQGEAYGWVPGDYRDAGATAPWQQDYLASITIMAARHGNGDALTFLRWQENFLVGRFNAVDRGLPLSDGASYRLAVFDPTTGVPHKTWAEIAAATSAQGWSSNGVFTDLNYAQLALATLAGIYEVTGSAAAAETFWRVAAEAPAALDYFATYPTNAFAPPPGGGRQLSAGAASALLTGGGAADTLIGGNGNDTLVGLGGNDSMLGGAGNDSLSGGAGADTLIGGIGDDTLDGGAGADSLVGGPGNDVYIVDSPSDVIVELANAGDDLVLAGLSWVLGPNIERLRLTGTGHFSGTGNALDNRIEGNAGDNLLNGGAGNDTLIGGAGNDTLVGGIGADSMVGGPGDDVYYVNEAGDRVVELAGGGTDLVIALTDYVLPAHVENLRISGSEAYSGTGNALDNVITGNGAANLILGLDGNDSLYGGAGADTLVGGNGNDLLHGGIGADSMVGGSGNDTYYVDNALDVVVELAGGGIDRVIATISYVLGQHVENLTLGNGGAFSGTGNGLANMIEGNAAANVLWGLGGNDTLIGGGGNDRLLGGDGADLLIGGPGNDILTGGPGADTFRFTPGGGLDRVMDFAPGLDRIEVSSSVISDLLPLGQVSADAFRVGAAVGRVPQFVYAPDTGILRWDPDGPGGVAAIPLAVFTGAPAITAADLWIVDALGSALRGTDIAS